MCRYSPSSFLGIDLPVHGILACQSRISRQLGSQPPIAPGQGQANLTGPYSSMEDQAARTARTEGDRVHHLGSCGRARNVMEKTVSCIRVSGIYQSGLPDRTVERNTGSSTGCELSLLWRINTIMWPIGAPYTINAANCPLTKRPCGFRDADGTLAAPQPLANLRQGKPQRTYGNSPSVSTLCGSCHCWRCVCRAEQAQPRGING